MIFPEPQPHDWNAMLLAENGDERTVSFGGAWENYRWSGAWNRIRAQFVSDGAGWRHDQSPWSIVAPSDATKRITLVDENAYDPHLRAERHLGDWPTIELDHPDASPVEGIIDEAYPGQVRYPNAFGDGVGMRVGIWMARYPYAEHVIYTDRMPQGGAEYLDIVERVLTPLHMPGWDGSAIDIGATGAALLTANLDGGIRMKPAVAWYRGADGALVTTPISVIAERMSGYTRLTKRMPAWFIAQGLAAGALRIEMDETTTTYYSDANPETTSVDGTVTRSGSNLTWSDIRTGSGTASADSGAFGAGCWLDTGTTTDGWALMRRSIFLFDTSGITSANAVSAATFGIYGSARTNTYATSPDMGIVSSSPASNTALASSDYGSLGTTDYAPRVTYASWSGGGGLSTWSFNATGKAAVNVSGITKLGARLSWDIDDAPPTWGSSKLLRMTGNFAEIGDSTKAYLTVTYSPAPTFRAALSGGRRRRVIGGGII